MILFLPLTFLIAPIVFYKFQRFAYVILILGCITSTFLPFFVPFGITEFTWFTLQQKSFKVSLNNDSLAQQLIFLVNFIGACVVFYSQYYFKQNSFRYWLYLSLFLGSMHGLIISYHAIFIFFFWELIGISSFLLIGYYYEKKEAIYGSSKALWINKIGDIGFLIGILGIFLEYKSFDIGTWLEKGVFPTENSWILWFLILGALAKSAQGPFMIWLPDAMAGPTPASALIHAATMVAAGIYLLFRLHPIFTTDIQFFLLWLGSITALLGALYAFFQIKIKAILAGSTISQLGWMLSALGTAFPLTAIEHLWAHAFFKAALFLTAGFIMLHQEHLLKPHQDPQNILLMGNFYNQNPLIYTMLAIQLAALIGLPITSGFLTKEAILAAHEFSLTYYILLFSLILTVFYCLKILFALKKESQPLSPIKLLPKAITYPIFILTLSSLFFVVSSHPLHIEKTQFPHVSLSIPLVSIITIIISSLIFWQSKNLLITFTSKLVSEFWGLNYFYNLWISQNFISRLEMIEKQNHFIINHFLNPLLVIGNSLKFLEEKWINGLIHGFKVLLVTGKWMGISISIAHFFQWLDTYIWDFGILNLTNAIKKMSQTTATLHFAKIQTFWIYSFLLLLLIAFLLVFVY